jgi:hypothetical protein
MALQFKLQLVVVTDDDQQVSVDELVVLTKDDEQLEHVGLTLAEAKALLVQLQHNQERVFLSDGEESLRQLQCCLRPHSQHWLDWCHLTMQLTGLSQSLRG